MSIATPPGSPNEGDLYVVASSPTGAWTGEAGNFAYFINAAWIILTPYKGVTIYDFATSSPYVYNGSTFIGVIPNGGFNYYLSSPLPTIPTLPVTGLVLTLPSGTGVMNGTTVSFSAITSTTLTANYVYDYWLNTDGSWTIESQPKDDYPFLPHHDDKLHVWAIATNSSNIIAITLSGNTYPTVQKPNDIGFSIDTFVENYYNTTTTTNWSASLTVTYGEKLLTTTGNVYLMVGLGAGPFSTGSTAPTSTDPTAVITDGTATLSYVCHQEYLGMFEYSVGGGIEYYFANVGLQQICHKSLITGNIFTPPGGTPVSTLVKSHILGVFFNLLTPRQNSASYLFGMKMIVGGYIWICTTAGTSASSSPFIGSYTVGTSSVTDGTAVFKCIFISYASQEYFWLDTNSDFVTYRGPDSHDNYASTFFNLIARYIQLTGDSAWLLTNSPQPNGSSGYLTYKVVLDNIAYFNLDTQIANFLTYGFQSGINPADGSTYNVQQLEDNCGVYSGYNDLAYIRGVAGDPTGQATALANAAYIADGIRGLFNVTYNLFATYYGQDITTWVSNSQISWYPYLQAQLYPEYYNIPTVTDDIRKIIRYNVSLYWPNYLQDKALDSYPNNQIGFMAANQWQDPAKAMAFLEKTERYFITGGTVAQGAITPGGPTTIAEMGYYLAIKDMLIPPLSMLNVTGNKINFLNQSGEVAPYSGYKSSGTVTLNGVTPATVADANFITNSMVDFRLQTVGGTVGQYPSIKTVTPGTGFTVAGTALDTSTYIYTIKDF